MSLRCLVVEDEALLALELEDTLQANGHQVVGAAMTKQEAIRVADVVNPELAFVDIHLMDGPTGVDVARSLIERGIPVVFMTANIRRIPDDFAGAIGVIEKPYTMNGLENAVGFLTRLVENGDSDTPVPPSLKLRPGRRGDSGG